MAERKTLRGRRIARLAATGLVLLLAVLLSVLVWQYYVTAPWTRDGQVRAQVAGIAPQVAGQIVELRAVDNQFVRKGDVLYVVDPFDYQVALDSAKAEVANRAADLQVKRAQAARRLSLSTVATSVEEKQQYAGTAKIAEAAYANAQAQLNQAEINLKRTRVQSPVNGYVTNLLLRVGDYATKGTTNIFVVDADSFWVDGYFEETKMAHIRVGDRAQIALMGYAPPLTGQVESITRGIATANASASAQGLPSVNPVYTWVRLAQRVPVRIRILAVPAGVPLVAGMTATITVQDPSRPADNRFQAAFNTVGANVRSLLSRDTPAPTPVVTTTVQGAATVSTIPLDQRPPPAAEPSALPLGSSGTDPGPAPIPPGGRPGRPVTPPFSAILQD